MEIQFVTVAQTWTPPVAWVIRNRLAAAGVDAFVQDEMVCTMKWTLANAIGGAKVQVPRSQLTAALAILAESPTIDGDTDFEDESPYPGGEQCGECGSDDVARLRSTSRWSLLFWLFSFSFPWPYLSSSKVYFNCDKIFGIQRTFRLRPNLFRIPNYLTVIVVLASVYFLLYYFQLLCDIYIFIRDFTFSLPI